MKEQSRHHARLVAAAVIALAVLGVVIVGLDWRDAYRVFTQANWELVGFALLATAISYGCLSWGFAVVCRICQVPMPQRRLLEIGFVSITLNHLMSTGGMAGLSLRLLLMRRQGLQTHQIISASIFHSYFNNLALLTLLPVGLMYILLKHPLTSGQYFTASLALAAITVVLSLATAAFFMDQPRAVSLRVLGRIWRLVRKRDIGDSLQNFNTALSEGVAAVRSRPIVLLLPVALIIGDWVSNVATLWFCFDALGDVVSPGILLTGFVVGIAVGLVSLVPGGLGVQDGSMAGMYALLGVPLEQSVLAAVLFRVVYYFIPFGLSMLLYRKLLRVTRQEMDLPLETGRRKPDF